MTLVAPRESKDVEAAGFLLPASLRAFVRNRETGLVLTGMLIGVQLLGNMQSFTVTIQFDEPVNVTPTFMFAALRHRVVSTVDIHGISNAMRGNGNPQMILRRA